MLHVLPLTPPTTLLKGKINLLTNNDVHIKSDQLRVFFLKNGKILYMMLSSFSICKVYNNEKEICNEIDENII